jgi:hypothetical protein
MEGCSCTSAVVITVPVTLGTVFLIAVLAGLGRRRRGKE